MSSFQNQPPTLTMADWEALFAQASDIPTSNTSSSKPLSSKRSSSHDDSENDNQDDSRRQKTKKSKKKHKRQRTHSNSNDSSAYQAMLKSRLDHPPGPSSPWFSWMALKESFLDGNDQCATEQGSSSSSHSKSSLSQSKQSRLSFRLILSKQEEQYWYLRLFCHCRNLRCCAKLLAQWDKNRSDATNKDGKGGSNQKQSSQQREKRLKLLFRNLQQEANEIIGMTQSVLGNVQNQDEANFLLSRASEVTGLVEKLLRQRKREDKRTKSSGTKHEVPSWSWEPCIRIIMACDALYYRLYYQQLTGIIPIHGHATDEALYIPHPQFYFGLEGLTMQSKDVGRNDKLLQSAQEMKDSSPELGALLDHLVGHQDESRNHALEAIHCHRLQETISLFHDWASSPSTLAPWKQSFSQQLDPHETPAPQILMDWRDSCRDFLCHLYAYTTISSKTLHQLVALLAQIQEEESLDLSKGIVEIGAGTGYLAELLQRQGLTVDAWDIQPTSNCSHSDNRGGMNEYHGHVPPFCDVRKASTFPSSCEAKRSALLLCYPPPESPMALNTLSAYRKAGGRCLIHIGEFKGLTGDSSFEKALLKGDMQCIARHPCLGWGTDAACVTVWITKGSKRKDTPSSSSVLLPCYAPNCVHESTWRCRPCRSVVYCSKDCYDEHSSARNLLFSLFNVHTDPNLTSFGSSKSFAPL